MLVNLTNMGNKNNKVIDNDIDNMDDIKCKLIENYVIKEKVITISKITICSDYIVIENCSYDIYLHYDDPNFVSLYNKIKIGLTYKFIIKEEKHGLLGDTKITIVDIIECKCPTHTYEYVILGFLRLDNNLEPDNLKLNNFCFKDYEGIFTGSMPIRCIIHKDNKKDIIIGKKYKIIWQSLFGSNYCLITDYELIN